MKYSIKTINNKYWIGSNGEFITKNKKERAIYDNKILALWYINGTNIFGELKLIKETK